MARRSSRRRRSRRSSKRRSRRRSSRRRSSVRRNPRWVVANRRRRRLRRNQGWLPSWQVLMRDVITPVIGASAGFIAARYAGNMLAERDLGTTDPKIAKTIAAGIGIPAVYALRTQFPMIGRNAGAIVLGMGMASAESWIRDVPMLGGSPAAAAVTDEVPMALTAGPDPIPETDIPGEVEVVENGGTGSYYDYPTNQYGQAALTGMLGGLGDHPGVEAISTVTPTGVAMRATNFPQVRKVTERFASQGDRGQAGGIFARTLYSGMLSG